MATGAGEASEDRVVAAEKPMKKPGTSARSADSGYNAFESGVTPGCRTSRGRWRRAAPARRGAAQGAPNAEGLRPHPRPFLKIIRRVAPSEPQLRCLHRFFPSV